jgi:hypothetical protein
VKTVILACGLSTRLAETETKPILEFGRSPSLWAYGQPRIAVAMPPERS